MRFLLLLIPLVFAQAPINDVISYNLIGNFNDAANSTFAQNSTLEIFNQTMFVQSNLSVIGTTLRIDNVTYPSYNLSIILHPSVNYSNLNHLPVNTNIVPFFCDRAWFDSGAQYASFCDFDYDSCAEYVNENYIVYDMTAIFTYKNQSEAVNVTRNLVRVPGSIMNSLRNASGFDGLNITLSGNLTIVYEINDRSGTDCGINNLVNYSANHSYEINESITVGGFNKIFFLRSPILREQWFRNNQFNVVILSQVPLEYAEIYRNGNVTRNFTLRNYSTPLNSYGVMVIESEKNESEWSEFYNETSPFPLENFNHSFAYIYQFNFSYQGIGENNLSILVRDSFGGISNYTESISSKTLSYNKSWNELGGPADENSRNSGQYVPGKLSNVELAFGFLSVLVLLIFVNYWVKK